MSAAILQPIDDEVTVRIVRRSTARKPSPVLVVSGRDSLLRKVTALLGGVAQTCVAAASVEAAEQLLVAREFSAIALDLRLVESDGQDLIRSPNRHSADIALIVVGDREQGDAWPREPVSGCDCPHADVASPEELIRVVAQARGDTSRRRLVRQATRLLARDPYDTLNHGVTTPHAIATVLNMRQHLNDESPAERVEALVRRCRPVLDGLRGLSRRFASVNGEGAESLRKAVRWFGVMHIQRMAEIVATRVAFPVADPALARAADDIWTFGVARAEAMELLAGRAEAPPRWWYGDVYRAGLFADAGAWLVLWLADQFGYPGQDSTSGLTPALQLLGDHHEWMGEELIRRWGMTEEIARLAGNHHPRPNRVHLPFWPLALAASDIADEVVASPERALGRTIPVGAALDRMPLAGGERRHLIDAVSGRVRIIREALDETFDRAGDRTGESPHQSESIHQVLGKRSA